MKRIFRDFDVDWVDVIFAVILSICALAVLTLTTLLILDNAGVISIFVHSNEDIIILPVNGYVIPVINS